MEPFDPNNNPATDSQISPTFDQEEPIITVGDGQRNQKEGLRSVISTIAILVAAPLVALVLITFVFQSYEVDGPSMENTLQNHDRLIVDKIPRTMARIKRKSYIPNRGDIIIFVKRGLFEFGATQEKQLIKRVIGIPGDHVVVKDGKITVSNAEHPNGYNPDLDVKLAQSVHETTGNIDLIVGNDEVFVCGDNRPNSLDSRFFGPVPATDIVGKLSYRIYPIGKAQSFNY